MQSLANVDITNTESRQCLSLLSQSLLYAALQLDGAQQGAREGAAARVAVLAVTILTALNVHSQADKDTKIKPLLSAAWRVSHQP